jgi:two-component system OmpR family sensor kinase
VSLRGRLVLALSAVALAALLVADLVTYSALRSFLYSRVDQSLAAASGPLERDDGGGGGGPILPGPEAPATDGSTPPGAFGPRIFFEQRDGSGAVVRGPVAAYQADGKKYSPRLAATITGFHPLLGLPDPAVTFDAPSTAAGGPRFRVLAIREPSGSVVVVGASLADTDSTLRRLLLIESAVTASALLAAIALGWWLVRVGLRPLVAIEDTADAIAEGELTQRVPGENAKTEVGRLARALNTMLGRIEGAFAARDATEDELRQSEGRLRQFVADASHELRTPIAAVSAYAELFDRGARERPGDLDRVVSGIRAETGRMSRLVEDLLLLARLDEGRPLERAPVELVGLAGDAVRTATTVGPAWPVALLADRPVEVVGDASRLRQVLDNLLANVRAHTPAGTSATLRVVERDGEAVIEVADTGPGVDRAVLGHVFERFYRADASRSRAHGGTGLGLSIVAAIVSAHGGRVAVAAREGGGTIFAVHLPPAAEESAAEEPTADDHDLTDAPQEQTGTDAPQEQTGTDGAGGHAGPDDAGGHAGTDGARSVPAASDPGPA